MSAAEIAKVLKGHRSGQGYVARCPAHDDRRPSLSICDVDGKVLVHCHAGCDQERVIAVIRARGLWPEKRLPCVFASVSRAYAERRSIEAFQSGARKRWRSGIMRGPQKALSSRPISPRVGSISSHPQPSASILG